MECGFCAKRFGKFVAIIQGKEITICSTCNQRWQLDVKAVA
jgi:hypothetical protein